MIRWQSAALVLATLVHGCAAGDTGSPGGSPGGARADETCGGRVTVLSGIPYQIDGATLRLPLAGNERMLGMPAGHVLVSADGNDGFGFMAAVAQVSEVGDEIVIETGPADLTQLECEAAGTGSFGGGGEDGDDRSDVVLASINPGPVSLMADVEAGAFVDVEPSAQLDVNVDLEGQLSFWGDTWGKFSFEMCLSGSTKASAGIDGLYLGVISKTVLEKSLAVWVFALPTPVGVPLPVTINPKVAASIGALVLSNGPVTMGAEWEYSGCIGFSVKQTLGLELPEIDHNAEFSFEVKDSFVEANSDYVVRLFGMAPDLNLCLYDVLCVAAGIQSYVEWSGNGDQDKVCAGLRLWPRFTAELPLFKGSLLAPKVTYFSLHALDLYATKLSGQGECIPPAQDQLSDEEKPPLPNGSPDG